MKKESVWPGSSEEALISCVPEKILVLRVIRNFISCSSSNSSNNCDPEIDLRTPREVGYTPFGAFGSTAAVVAPRPDPLVRPRLDDLACPKHNSANTTRPIPTLQRRFTTDIPLWDAVDRFLGFA